MQNAARSYPGKIAALVSLAFVLAFIGFSIMSLFRQPPAWAAEEHITRPSSATYYHSVSTSFSTKASLAPLANTAAPDPIIINDQWYCQPPYTAQARLTTNGTGGAATFDESCVEHDLNFPCSDTAGQQGKMQPNENIIKLDWLSGDVPTFMGGPNSPHYAGHFTYTYAEDTYTFPAIETLFGFLEGFSFFLIIPSAILMAYNIMLGASTFRYAGSLEGLSRLLLGGLAIGVSFTLVQMLINLEILMTTAINQLHAQFPFPQVIKGIPISYTLSTEPPNRIPGSYRGLVVPMSRWGCAANDFVGLFSQQFITSTVAPVIPIIGNLAHLAGTVTTLPDLIHRIAEMIMTVLSILLWAQVFIRIIVLNYYILMAPLSFSCWALPGGIGQRVVALWFKGFFSVLFVQALQLFIITTLPLILPTLPQISADSAGLMQGFLVEFPPILALLATLMAPTLIGVSAEKVFGTASSMAGQTISVIGTAASQVI